MEIVKRGQGSFNFIVLRSFYWHGRSVQPKENLQIEGAEALGPEVAGLVNVKKISPVYPETVECIALGRFSVPGKIKKFECKNGERIIVRGIDLLQMVLANLCLPLDPTVWRPLGRHLKEDKEGK